MPEVGGVSVAEKIDLARFQITAGSVQGRDHRTLGINCQDAYAIRQESDRIIAVVCDGCGSSPYSEVGARLGAQMVANVLNEPALEYGLFPTAWLQRRVTHCLHELVVSTLGNDDRATKKFVYDHLLFTINGVVITPETTTFFSWGDGSYAWRDQNGRTYRRHIGPFQGNAPPYIAYKLLGTEPYEFKLQQISTEEVSAFLIATDGLDYLLKASALGKTLYQAYPDTIEDIEYFWDHDSYYRNPELLNKRLGVLARDIDEIRWDRNYVQPHRGVLADDLAIVAGRVKYI